MKQTGTKQNTTSQQQSKSIPKSTVQKGNVTGIKKSDKSNAKGAAPSKYKIDAISKNNFDISTKKQNITEIGQLQLKYVLKCIDGLYKNRFLFITTHPDGQIFGSGDAKLNSLTLQIEGVGLAPKHAQLRYDGFKSFNVKDFGSQAGTWMNIPDQGTDIAHGDNFSIGPYLVAFEIGDKMDEIQEICAVYSIHYMSDVLKYNQIKTMADLLKAEYNNFSGYPFDKKQIEKLKRICNESKNWYQQNKKYKKLNMIFLNEPLKDFSMEVGWETFSISSDPQLIFTGKNPVAQIVKGRLLPMQKVFTKIKQGKQFPLSLHSQIKIGNLSFQMTRFNSGSGVDVGFRNIQQDGLIIQEDIGGSEWKLISLFAVFDGHGGPQCMKFMCENLVRKIREWTHLLDQAGDINEMTKLLMNKTFYELDYQFYKKYPDLSQTCGATGLVVLIIQKRVYSFHVGDCKGYLFRRDILFQLNLDHVPSRGDQRLRIESAGGFIQYDRLMGKCTLSRCLGQFQYKSTDDYQNQFKGKLKSYLSCIPQMVAFDIQVQNDQFILMSTDGIFEGMNIHQITDFIMERYEKLETQQNPNKIISSILQNCKITNQDCDNMAVILIIIRKGEVK